VSPIPVHLHDPSYTAPPILQANHNKTFVKARDRDGTHAHPGWDARDPGWDARETRDGAHTGYRDGTHAQASVKTLTGEGFARFWERRQSFRVSIIFSITNVRVHAHVLGSPRLTPRPRLNARSGQKRFAVRVSPFTVP